MVLATTDLSEALFLLLALSLTAVFWGDCFEWGKKVLGICAEHLVLDYLILSDVD